MAAAAAAADAAAGKATATKRAHKIHNAHAGWPMICFGSLGGGFVCCAQRAKMRAQFCRRPARFRLAEPGKSAAKWLCGQA